MVQRFNVEAAQIWQWDDCDVLHNWSAGEDLAVGDR